MNARHRTNRTRGRLARRLASEAGIGVPVVMIAILIGFSLATITVVASVASQGGTVRDQKSKAALAAAEAGVNQALLRYNKVRLPPFGQTDRVCLNADGAPTAPQADGWCSPVAGSVTGAGSQFSYSVCPRGLEQGMPCPSSGNQHNIEPGSPASALEIVSTGCVPDCTSAGNVTRRVQVQARSSGGLSPFGNASVIGLNGVRVNQNATITANVATNYDITLDSSGSQLSCLHAQVGPGHLIVPSNPPPPCVVSEGTISLPPVNQGDVRDNNSNGRLPPTCPLPGAPEPSGCDVESPAGRVVWNPQTRELTVNGGGGGSTTGLTLGGANYSLCKLTLNTRANLYIVAGATVRIYFDAPENCPTLSAAGGTQLDMASNSRIAASAGDPTHVALLAVGSDSRPTYLNFSSNTDPSQVCNQDFVVYAPRSTITLASNSSYCGALAGRTVLVNSNSKVVTNEIVKGFTLSNSVSGHYAAEHFVECSSPPVSPPNAGC